jgi:diacylglycerol kinase family enzyme
MTRAAVVTNPTKHGDGEEFRKTVCSAMSEHGWDEPLWLETTASDPGAGHALQAVQAGVDLVLACGGDGTVTSCVEGVAGSGTPLAVLPIGTGNLLARNLGLPLDLGEALMIALTGGDRRLDVGCANGRPFVVMAGLGLDAKMLDQASEPLKKRLGWAAYSVSALRHLRDRPVRVRLVADGGPARTLRASAVIVGNVGRLQGGIPLLPEAAPDDGWLDAAVLAARGWGDWIALAAQVILQRQTASRVTRIVFRELVIDVRGEQPWEIDGEVMGGTRRLAITVQPGALLLRGPVPVIP